MPILPPEPAVFPEGLFDEADPSTGRAWWVLHTRPRQEKSLARQLHEKGIPFYLPLISRRLRFRGRVLTSRVPLFGGYVFLQADPDERLAALATKRVAQALPVADQVGLWHDLRQVYRLIAAGAPVTPEERLAPGMAVEIREGPLAGLKGKIIRTASGRRFLVQVDFIQRGASVLLDDLSLVPVMTEALA
jgi:transcription antitermination factor NusG